MKDFLQNWDENYKASLKKIPLFDPAQTSRWSKAQQQLFIKLLYHQRGHFDDILWLMGNSAPDAHSKEVILQNIREEFGHHAPSHEKLYLDFAKSHHVDLTYELIEERWYLPFLREYNQGILRWLRDHNWDHRIVAFAAIERLDNLDYPALKEVAISFNTPNKALVFFNAHIHVKHYEEIEESIVGKLWIEKELLFREVFNFVGSYQVNVWEKISSYIFSYRE